MLSKLEDEHKIILNELITRLVDKLLQLVKSKQCKGVRSVYNDILIPSGSKFSQQVLRNIDYASVDYSNWTDDTSINNLIARLLHNYSIKVNEEVGRFKREKFNISIGDELPAGVLKLAKVYMAKNVN